MSREHRRRSPQPGARAARGVACEASPTTRARLAGLPTSNAQQSTSRPSCRDAAVDGAGERQGRRAIGAPCATGGGAAGATAARARARRRSPGPDPRRPPGCRRRHRAGCARHRARPARREPSSATGSHTSPPPSGRTWSAARAAAACGRASRCRRVDPTTGEAVPPAPRDHVQPWPASSISPTRVSTMSWLVAAPVEYRAATGSTPRPARQRGDQRITSSPTLGRRLPARRVEAVRGVGLRDRARRRTPDHAHAAWAGRVCLDVESSSG